MLVPHAPGYALYDERYPFLFNSYYVQAGERHCRAQRGYLSRPTVADVFAYRRHVTDAVADFLDGFGEAERPEIADVVEVGLHHEQQHQELMVTDLKHVFAVNPLRPVFRDRADLPSADPGPLRWRGSSPGSTKSGLNRGRVVEPERFHFDNEVPRHRAFVEPFELADRLVTCGDYLAFMDDGGYDDSAAVAVARLVRASRARVDGAVLLGAARRRVVARHAGRDAPRRPERAGTHVSYCEADAYARWAGARVPSEVEWEVAGRTAWDGSGDAPGSFADAAACTPPRPRPSAATAPATQPRSARCSARCGSGRTASTGRTRATDRSRALGEYNGKFMANQFVLRGGSVATSRSHIRPTYRNFFPPEATWQFTGLRLALVTDPSRLAPADLGRDRLCRRRHRGRRPSTPPSHATCSRDSPAPRSIPAKYFYDERGSRLFDEITRLDAYYPTRTERRILLDHGDEMVDAIGKNAALVEYGSGSSEKTRVLLGALHARRTLAAYVPIDISEAFLLETAVGLRDAYPGLPVLPLAADYTRPLRRCRSCPPRPSGSSCSSPARPSATSRPRRTRRFLAMSRPSLATTARS